MIRTAPVPPLDLARLEAIAAKFIGTITQTPPIFSAIKRGGVPLYKLARRGEEVAPPAPRQVEIARLELIAEGAGAIRFTMVCSPGTYVRSLARDIGLALDSAAHLAELQRVRNGAFAIESARSLDAVLAALESGGDGLCLIGLRDAVPDLPEAAVDEATAKRLRNGDSRALDGLVPTCAGWFKVVADDRLLAVAEATSRVTAVIARIFGEGREAAAPR